MIVELDKIDVINMLHGIDPSYEKIDKFESLGLGHYVGGFADRWEWDGLYSPAWERYTEEQLFDFYQELKEDDERFRRTIQLH